MKGILKDTFILFVITLVAGFCLGGVHDITLEPIAKAQQASATATYKEVYPDAANFQETDELIEQASAAAADLEGQGFGKVSIDGAMEAVDANGAVIGYLITSTSSESYGGDVQISVGITADGTITGVGFLAINDTPGLGMKAKEPAFKDQFNDRAAQTFEVTKTAASGDAQIQAISGATITSSAVTNAVNAAVYFYTSCVAQ